MGEAGCEVHEKGRKDGRMIKGWYKDEKQSVPSPISLPLPLIITMLQVAPITLSPQDRMLLSLLSWICVHVRHSKKDVDTHTHFKRRQKTHICHSFS